MADGKAIFYRITSVLKEKDLKRLNMCNTIGISSQNITNIKKSIPAADTAIKIADYLCVSVKWLITGEDETGLTDGEKDILEAYNQLNDIGKDAAIGAVKALIAHFPQLSEQDGVLSEMAT
jgi:DNA-binding XRE family transcriptional regulator